MRRDRWLIYDTKEGLLQYSLALDAQLVPPTLSRPAVALNWDRIDASKQLLMP